MTTRSLEPGLEEPSGQEAEADPAAPELTLSLALAALDAVDAMVVITDLEGRIRYVNRAFTETTGFPPEEVVGATPRVLRSGQHDGAFYGRLWSTVLGGGTWEGEIINRRRNGELYTDRMTISPVRAANGRITHMVAIKRDVSARVDDLLAASPYGVLHLGGDAALVYANARACELLDHSFEELLGSGWRTVLGPAAEALADAVRDASERGEVPQQHRTRVLDVAGRHLRVHLGLLRPGQAAVLGCVVALEDATAELKATAALADRERFARTVIDVMDSPTAVVDRTGRIIQVNPAWADSPEEDHLLGTPPGTSLLELDLAPETATTHGSLLRVIDAVRVAIGEAQADPRVVEHLSPGPRARWWQIRVTHLPISAGGAVITASDITSVRRAQQRSAVDARTDALTGLRNRRGLEEVLEAVATSAGTEPIAVLFCDLDRFKPVNDAHGHAAGDELLRAVAGRLVGQTRDGDLVARPGGDEFVAVLPGTDQGRAEAIAKRMEAVVARPFRLEDGLEVSIGISIGVAVTAERATVRELLTAADRAMYTVKRDRRASTP
ncbi:MAG: diguanylate cyclase domain-containing protein [Nitriliruptoraceae bacterium]